MKVLTLVGVVHVAGTPDQRMAAIARRQRGRIARRQLDEAIVQRIVAPMRSAR